LAWCHIVLGIVAYRTGNYEEAQKHHEAAQYLFRWEAKDSEGLAEALNGLGLCSKQRCDLTKAAEYFTSAHELCVEVGSYRTAAIALQNIGIVEFKLGNWTDAESRFKEALAANQRIGRRIGVVRSTIGYANVLRAQGRWQDAEPLYVEARNLAEAGGFQREKVLATEFLGELCFDQGKVKEALLLYDQGLSAAEAFAPEGDLITELCRRRAEAYLAIGDIEQAQRELNRALKMAQKISDVYELGALYRVEGIMYARLGSHEKAVDRLRTAMGHFETVNEKPELTKAMLALGIVLRDGESEGEKQTAGRLLLKAQINCEDMGSQSLYDRLSETLGLLGVGSTMLADSGAHYGVKADDLISELPFKIIAEDPTMHEVVRRAAQLSMNGARVLIQGETGVGKNLLADIFRHACQEAGKPFVELDCATLPSELVESELFGHVRGAFSGAVKDKAGILEQADGGTVFLNEIGELSPRLQTKLLTVLDDGVYRRVGDCSARRLRVRVIAATNRDIAAEVEKGTFRRDLYYRLSQVLLWVPPLRQRPNDVQALAEHFLAEFGKREEKSLRNSQSLLKALKSYSWPGNVRELQNLMETLVLSVPDGAVLESSRLLRYPGIKPDESDLSSSAGNLNDRVEAFKRREVTRVLEDCAGNRTQAADVLGVSRAGLLKMLKRFNVDPH
jgi:DNA-binding NtrC family response regulator/tetratricopeptide (TPR) repeat protein